jgi:rod shape-determining protein MreD
LSTGTGAVTSGGRFSLLGPWAVGGLVLICVLLEVTVMPFIRVADGIPDLVAVAVVAVGVFRGPLLGGITGFSAGLLMELAAPIGTLGVLALLYLVAGWFAGRFTERPEAATLLVPLVLAVATAGFVQAAYAVIHMLLGETLPASFLVANIVLPQMALTALLTPPVLLVARRLLGSPRTIEPHMMPS